MPSRLARALWSARTDGGRVGVEDAERPRDEAAAYAVQAEITGLFESPQIGWKLGATNQKTLDLLGFERPFAGPLLARHLLENGAVVRVHPEHAPSLETEFMVVLGADLAPRATAYSEDEVIAAVDSVRPAFEVVGCRVEDGFAAAGLLLVADGAANLAVVEGTGGDAWRDADLSDHPLRVEVNGVEAATGSSNLLMWGNPFGAVAYLAAHPLTAERGLRAGDRIMTGTCGGLIPLTSGDRATADFGALGTVALSIA